MYAFPRAKGDFILSVYKVVPSRLKVMRIKFTGLVDRFILSILLILSASWLCGASAKNEPRINADLMRGVWTGAAQIRCRWGGASR